uniref:lysosome-associated membrane glycoprotein 1b n=1 Tax=Gasterosteus aculeatus aculeatus TaxID=481459 RepID=UPI001A982DB3|nr:lysosome-associated membrane glycoprotein 1b [Gasterosteus aculeatus aculeatus]XP_040057638.1 lysosome-associated membrane glycoprotein 1b [Gasterosteus aculeatus aculeatus]XP_040057639.1 lysosome-associated membrane glycoprotein 1b [Gasterosteus aculeatus aculeatus]
MTQIGGVQPWFLGVTLQLILAAVLHQGLATVAPPTTAQTTAAPHKDPGRPEKGNYVVASSNGTACLLASMGLQLNVTFNSQNKTVQEVLNLRPNVTKASGSCESDRASLLLSSEAEKINLTFIFTLNATSKKYHLSEVSLSADLPDMKERFSATNRSLDSLRGTFGFSYMCHEEQTLTVAQNFSINTFQPQVQPFGLSGDQFGAAEECQLDEDNVLIPIVVGAALAGLVLIVLLAYLIGRKRSHAGYQTI